MQVVPLAACPAPAVQAFLRSSAVSRYLVDGPYAHGDGHARLSRLVLADAAREDAVAWAAGSPLLLRALLVLRLPAWDREHFGFAVARVEHLQAADAAAARILVRHAVRELADRRVGLCSARLSSDALACVEALEDEGFRYRELTLSPWRDLRAWRARGFGVTRPAAADDVAAIAGIARRAFRTDRFHRDARLDPAAADGLYERWVRSWFARDDGDARARVLVAGGEVRGFFLYDLQRPADGGDTVARLVLDAVDPAVAGRGHGYRMYCDVLDEAARLARYADVVVSAANPAVVHLYGKLGFRVTSGGEVTLHRWSPRDEEDEACVSW